MVTLEELEATTPGPDNCCSGKCTNFWVDQFDPGATLKRVNKALDLFYSKFPSFPRDLTTPKCDFDRKIWYANDEWPRLDPWATPT